MSEKMMFDGKEEMFAAYSFLWKHPITEYLTDKHIDRHTCALRESASIRFAIIGYGELARQVHALSEVNNRFFKLENNLPYEVGVEYRIHDSGTDCKGLEKERPVQRYREFLENVNPAEYLPLPKLVTDNKYYNISPMSDSLMRAIADMNDGKKSANFVFVGFSSDEENISLAKRIAEQFPNMTVFAATRELSLGATPPKNLIAVCTDSDIKKTAVLYKMAFMRNLIYDLDYLAEREGTSKLTEERVRRLRLSAEQTFLKKSDDDRASSLSCVLSLPFRLQLMGLEISDESSGALDYNEYMSIYAEGDLPETHMVSGIRIVDYPTDFKLSKRRNLAQLEHYRWNAFGISRGTVPASLTEILTERREDGGYTNGKNPQERRHGNLTDFEGLLKFAAIVAHRDGVSTEFTDVIRYDYQILDDAYTLLKECGLYIHKRNIE